MAGGWEQAVRNLKMLPMVENGQIVFRLLDKSVPVGVNGPAIYTFVAKWNPENHPFRVISAWIDFTKDNGL